LLIALAALALSAGAVLAGRGLHPAPANAPANALAPSVDQGDQGDQDQQGADEGGQAGEPGADAPDTEAPDADQGAAADAPEAPESDGGTGTHPDNHGKAVSEAAQGPTPAGFRNHGQYVKTVAHDNKGQATSAAAKAKP